MQGITVDKIFTQGDILDALSKHCVFMYVMSKGCEDEQKKQIYLTAKNAVMSFVSHYFFDGKDLTEDVVSKVSKNLADKSIEEEKT